MVPLEAAAECGLLDLARFLLVHVKDSKVALNDSLHCSATEGNAEVAQLLIDHGAGVDSVSEDVDASNALLRASKGVHLDVARVLINNGANVVSSDRWSWAPFHHAASRHAFRSRRPSFG